MLARRRRLAALFATAGVLLAGCSSTIAGQPQGVPVPPATGTVVAPATDSSGSSVPPQITRPTGGESDRPSSSDSPSEPTASDPGSVVSTPATVDGAVGDPGIGDPYYPESGNGGYNVTGYDVTMTYTPETNQLEATTVVSAKVTESDRLGQFNFDLQPSMKVATVTVNDQPAAFSQQQSELVIRPNKGLSDGADLTVSVSYSGQPEAISGGTASLGDGGWYRTPSGGAVAIGEPFSASAWYPVNEHPADTATFTVTATVPSKWKVIANGVPYDGALPAAPAGYTSTRWVQDVPVASYLTTIYIDTFTTTTDKLSDGTPIINAFAPGDTEDQSLAKNTKSIIELLTKYFGPYPFSSVGGIYTDQEVAFALETATRPVYANWVDLDTVIHELAHQWYGDQVTIERWSDICINECFASYAPWLWHEAKDGADLDAYWQAQMQAAGTKDFWSSPLVDMGAGNEFTRVYDRGPLALHAVRKEMGDDKFFTLLRKWQDTYKGRNATFDDWEKMASEVAGKDMTTFIDAWFRGTTLPAEEYLHPGNL
jgi:aminopeptidase N